MMYNIFETLAFMACLSVGFLYMVKLCVDLVYYLDKRKGNGQETRKRGKN